MHFGSMTAEQRRLALVTLMHGAGDSGAPTSGRRRRQRWGLKKVKILQIVFKCVYLCGLSQKSTNSLGTAFQVREGTPQLTLTTWNS